jgi:hypothetical protein
VFCGWSIPSRLSGEEARVGQGVYSDFEHLLVAAACKSGDPNEKRRDGCAESEHERTEGDDTRHK